MKKMTVRLAAAALAAAALLGSLPVYADSRSAFVSLGEDLTEEQLSKVLGYLDLTEQDLEDSVVITVSNEDEHRYLDSYLSAEQIGSRALSSCRVTGQKEGHGISVTTHNITYVTEAMYENALATAGMKNADVVVAGPSPISGTAALVGAMQAYAAMNGEEISPELIDGAMDELVTSGKLAESTGDADKTAKLIALVKQVIAEKDLKSREDIEEAIDEIALKLEISLSDEDRQMIRDLMDKLAGLDLNAKDLSEQAKKIYEEMRKDGLDLSQFGISDADAQGLLSRFSGLIREFLRWLQGILNR